MNLPVIFPKTCKLNPAEQQALRALLSGGSPCTDCSLTSVCGVQDQPTGQADEVSKTILDTEHPICHQCGSTITQVIDSPRVDGKILTCSCGAWRFVQTSDYHGPLTPASGLPDDADPLSELLNDPDPLSSMPKKYKKIQSAPKAPDAQVASLKIPLTSLGQALRGSLLFALPGLDITHTNSTDGSDSDGSGGSGS